MMGDLLVPFYPRRVYHAPCMGLGLQTAPFVPHPYLTPRYDKEWRAEVALDVVATTN